MEYFLPAVSTLFTPETFLLVFGGTILGIIFGAIPGLTGALAIVILLPFTYAMAPEPGIALLVSIYVGGISGGFISAALIGIPGTPASVATTFEAWPLTKKGGVVKALGIGIVASFIGTFFSCLVALFLSPVIADLAVKLGPWEIFGLCFLAISLIVSLSEGNIIKGLAGAAIGFLIGCIGAAPIDGTVRFSFGFMNLFSGIPLAATMIGFFAFAQVLVDFGKGTMKLPEIPKTRLQGLGFTLREMLDNTWNIIRSFFIGLGIGFLPGLGPGISSVVAYAKAKDASKHPEEFGKGTIEGIWATETANNATIGGAIVPMISLGIPGDSTTALLLGALTIQGMTPGPLLMTNHPHFTYVLFGALLFSALLTLVLQYRGMRFFPKLLMIKFHFLMPVIMLICYIGAYSDSNSIFTLGLLIVCGIMGFFLSWADIPLTPLILSYILAPLLETNLRRGISFSRVGPWVFLLRPISAALILLSVASIVYAFLKPSLKKRRAAKAAGSGGSSGEGR
jgi:putative tricarboxylic transport membrane protein